jgi:hypothetical protein
MRVYASDFSSSLRKDACVLERGRYHRAKMAKRMVPLPSMRKRYRHEANGPELIRNTPKESKPEKAEAILCPA